MPRKRPRPQRSRKPAIEQLKDMFALHMSERRGALLFMVILTILIAWVVYEQWLYTPPVTDLEPLKKELEEWVASTRTQQPVDATASPALFPFDPNSIDRDQWMEFGLTERQVDGLFRYLEKGGSFKVKKDVARIYTISPEMYARLEPFILLPDSIPREPPREFQPRTFPDRTAQRDTYDRREPVAWKERNFERPPVSPLDVNTADTTKLVTLPGIGPAFARGIVKYRESLGGYVSMDQLNEVFVLRDKPDAVERLKEILFLGSTSIRRIPINTATAEELAKHPYINFKIANGLVNYRKQHGPFQNVEAIKGSVLINDSLYQRIAPYLTADQ